MPGTHPAPGTSHRSTWFSVGGSRFAEFRVDAFNVTNSVRWANPVTGFSTAAGNTFGQITGTNGAQRSLRFGGRFVF